MRGACSLACLSPLHRGLHTLPLLTAALLLAARIYDNYVNIRDYFNTTLYPGVNMKEPMKW